MSHGSYGALSAATDVRPAARTYVVQYGDAGTPWARSDMCSASDMVKFTL
jgi:hypothetical protein